jgi:hypothetical protein
VGVLILALFLSARDRPEAKPGVPPAGGPSSNSTAASPSPALPPPRQLEGPKSLFGTISDDQGQAIEGALVRIRSMEEPEVLPREIHADSEGKFRLTSLPNQVLGLEVSAVGHDGVEHVVRPEDGGPLSLVLPRQGELLVELREQPGQPVEGAQVLLSGTGLWPAAECVADTLGQCLFRGLPGGQYQARARREGRVALPSPNTLVTPGQRARVELTLQPGASLNGKLVDADSGQALAGARVMLLDLTPGLPALETASDADGGFSFVGLWPGSVRIEGFSAGYAPEGFDTRLPVTGPLKISLHGSATLAGSVVGEQGAPLAGVLLSVSSREGLPVSASSARANAGSVGDAPGELGVTQGPVPRIPLLPEQTFALGTLAAQSDARGEFRIEGLKPGNVVLRASRPGFFAETVALDGLASHSTRSDLRIVLREGGVVEGRLVDARGRGVGGVYVAALLGEQVEQSGITDEQGEFKLRDLLGDVIIQVQPEGREGLSCKLTVRARAVARCDLSIASELFTLPVRVLDDYGFGLEGALVSARSVAGKRSFSQVTRDDGRVVLRELPEPPYLLGVELGGYLSLADEAVERAEQEVRVTLRKAASLSGQVVDTLGHPVPGAFVSTEEGDLTTETDELGNFALAQLAPGALTLWAAQDEAGEGTSAEVRARPGETRAGVRIVLAGRYSGEQPGARRVTGKTAEKSPLLEGHTTAREASPPERARQAPATPPKAVDLGLEQRPNAVVVTSVLQGGAAARAGLRTGDVIAAVDGETVLSLAHLRGMLRDPANTTARIRLLRNRQPVNVRYRRAGL